MTRYLSNYAEALALFRRIKPLRGSPTPHIRPLETRRSNASKMIIHHGGPDDPVVIRHHQLDVITFHPDGTIVVLPYCSKTTNEFVNSYSVHAMPMWTNRHCGLDELTRVYPGHEIYYTPSGAVFKDGKLIGGAEPIIAPRLDKRKASAALKSSGYKAFKTWLDVITRMDLLASVLEAAPKGRHIYGVHALKPAEVMKSLRDLEVGWPFLAANIAGPGLKGGLEHIRRLVFLGSGAVEMDELTHLDGYRHMARVLSARRKYL